MTMTGTIPDPTDPTRRVLLRLDAPPRCECGRAWLMWKALEGGPA